MPIRLSKEDKVFESVCNIIGLDEDKISSFILTDKDMSQPEVLLLEVHIKLSKTQTKEIMDIFKGGDNV